jgi:putative heme-binding domain-containing protein
MLAIVLTLALLGIAQAQESSKSITAAGLERGKRLYGMNCAGCHGIEGGGGSGPVLAKQKYRRAPDDAALIELIESGISEAGMPSSWHLLPDGPAQIAAYLRSLTAIREAPPTGDPSHGSEVFAKAGCTSCHIVNGRGSAIGPELTGIGARRTAETLRRALVNPGESATPEFTLIQAQTRSGASIRGLRLNEESFTIQIKDAAGRFHSLRKSELAQLERPQGASLMPSYSDSLGPSDLKDLLAYLVSLKEQQ